MFWSSTECHSGSSRGTCLPSSVNNRQQHTGLLTWKWPQYKYECLNVDAGLLINKVYYPFKYIYIYIFHTILWNRLRKFWWTNELSYHLFNFVPTVYTNTQSAGLSHWTGDQTHFLWWGEEDMFLQIQLCILLLQPGLAFLLGSPSDEVKLWGDKLWSATVIIFL